MRCAECGAVQSEAHRFCSNCGAALRPEGATVEATGPWTMGGTSDDAAGGGVHPDGPVLAVRAGGPQGALIVIPDQGVVTIGRSPTSDVFLDDVTVSRDHAQILSGDRGLILRDLGSLNGTYVNRRRIDEDEVLQDGDELQVGKFRLTFIAQ